MEGGGEVVAAAPAPAPRLKRPVRPDHKGMRKQAEKLTAEINKYADRMKEIKKSLEGMRRQPQAGSKEQAVLRRLDELRAEFEKCLLQKKSVRTELGRVNDSRDALSKQVKTLKEKLRTLSVEDIDSQIKKLEDKINHTTLSTREEAETINQIKQLAKSRETVRGHKQQLDKMQGDDELRESLLAKLKSLDEEMDNVKAQEAGLKKELASIREEKAGTNEDVELLIQERNECWEVMSALKQKRTEIEEDFNAKMDAFRREDGIYKEKLAEERKKKDEAHAADAAKVRAQKEARRSEYEASRKDAKKEENLVLCDQLLAYLGKYVQEKSEETKEKEAAEFAAPAEGMRLVKKGIPGDEVEDSWMFKGKGSAKKGGKGKKSRNTVEKPVEKRLNHTLDIMAAFHTLKVTLPNNVSEVPKTIEAVEERRKAIEQEKSEPKPSSSSAPAASASTAPDGNAETGKDENGHADIEANDISNGKSLATDENVEEAEAIGEQGAASGNGKAGRDEFPPLGAESEVSDVRA